MNIDLPGTALGGRAEGGFSSVVPPPIWTIDSMANAFKATKGLLQLLDT